MKLSKFWVFKLGLQATLGSFLIYTMLFILPKMFGAPEVVGILTILYLMCLIGAFALIFFFCETYKNEGKYYTKENVLMKDFKFHVFSNVYIFVYKHKAWVVDKKFKGVLDLEEVIIHYVYNRKKELINFNPILPYMMGA